MSQAIRGANLHPVTMQAVQALQSAAPGSDPFLLANYNTVGQVHQNVPLQQLLVAYDWAQDGFIADQVLPPLPVVNETDLFYKIDRYGGLQRAVETLVPDRAAAREVEWTWTTDTYQAQRYALAVSISDRERRNADNQLRLEETTTMLPAQLLMLDREVRAATLLNKTNTSGVTLSGADQFDNASFSASGVPIENRFDAAKLAMRQAIGRNPTHVIIPDQTAKVMKRDTKIRDLIKYTTNALVNGDLPDTLWGLKVIIPTTMYSASLETVSGTPTFSDIWGKDIRFVYVPPVPGIRVPATGYQFRISADDMAVEQSRDARRKVDYYEVGYTQDMKLVVPSGCYVLENPIS